MKKSKVIKLIMLLGLASIAGSLFGQSTAWDRATNQKLQDTPPVYFKIVDSIPVGLPSARAYSADIEGVTLNVKLTFTNFNQYLYASSSNPQLISVFQSTGEFKFVGHKPMGAGEVRINVGTDVENYTIGSPDKSFVTKVGDVDYKVTIHTDEKNMTGILWADSSATKVYLVSVSAEEIAASGQCNGNLNGVNTPQGGRQESYDEKLARLRVRARNQ